ncbi:GNAT family N-acetyltransferase [Spirulina sp. 06S082]|nr:GNAT family N-acetyltransferase [Spirulina sp. 06S082]
MFYFSLIRFFFLCIIEIALVSLSDSSPSVRKQKSTPLSQSPNLATPLEIRMANLGDVRGLSAILADSFYSHQGFMFLIHPLLRLGISEDLRTRLKSATPHYSCLAAIATIDTPSAQKQDTAGVVEMTVRSNYQTTKAKESGGKVGEFSDYLYLSNLAVSQSYRRQGIARRLLLSCEPLALKWGYQDIYLHVLDDNEGAKQLYLNLGYNIDRIESYPNRWIVPRPNRLLLRKTLV